MQGARGNLQAMDLIDPYRPEVPPGQDELPFSDGEPMESYRHVLQMQLLMESLADAWSERDDYFIGGNMFVYFSEPQARGEVKVRGPDVFVVLGTERHKRRKSWVAWQEEGKLPDIVIELLSPSTASIDRGEKKRIYGQSWRTGHYFLFDPHTGELEGHRLVNGKYEPIVPDARGDLPVESIGLALGLRDGTFQNEGGRWLRWTDPEGATITSGAERADGAQRTARAATEAARTATEAARAATEEARAATERAIAAERRIAELEAKLRGDG